MRTRRLLLPSAITATLVLSSFVPVLHVILLTVNGGIIFLFEMVLGNDSAILYWVNSVLSIFSIVAY